MTSSRIVVAMTRSPLYWTFIFCGNLAGFLVACHRHTVGWGLFHGVMVAMSLAYLYLTMGRRL